MEYCQPSMYWFCLISEQQMQCRIEVFKTAIEMFSSLNHAVAPARLIVIHVVVIVSAAGTHGAVSILGLLSAVVGGALVGVAYYLVLVMCFTQDALQPSAPQWPLIAVGAATGLVGSLVDSLLGATLQYSGMPNTIF